MRILKVVQAYFPFLEKGGPVVKVKAIARGLAARGHSVAVLTADYGLPSSPLSGFTVQKDKYGWRGEEDGVTAIYLRNFGRYRALTFNPGVVSFAAGSASDFDLVHIYGLYDLLGPIVAYFCRRHAVPYFIEPMGMHRPIVRNLRMKRIYHHLLGDSLLRGARLLIATSELERNELLEGGIESERIVVRHNGIEPPQTLPAPGTFRQRLNIPSQTKLILFLGRLVPKKSPELLIEAFARWRRSTPEREPSVLVVAGPEEEDGYGARLKTLAASAGIADNVLFTGPLYEEAKWAAYRDADVFVLPSLNENFGNAAAEAIACGTPVIVTDRCGIAPLVGERSGLVVEHDAGAVANALSLLLGDDRFAAHLRSNCAATAASLTWDQPLNQLEALYHEAIAHARQGEMAFERQMT